MRFKNFYKKAALGALTGIFAVGMSISATANAAPASKISFGVPSWPGVIVQSQVAADLL